MNHRTIRSLLASFLLLSLFVPTLSPAAAEFNPNYIISDTEIQDARVWTRDEIQRFLDSKGSYLRNYEALDVNGEYRLASDIIYNAAQTYNINPKFLLVNLQKEQSLITDDTPTQKQLDWAMGYAVCDSCSMDDPRIQKFKGFGKQVDNAAGIIRWYYENTDKSYVKKKDTPIRIDDQDVTPQSWATAFLYTYTPHIHGNKNFWRIWNTWFAQLYPNGSLLKSASTSEVWLLQGGTRRKFKNQTALISRADPKLVVTVPDTELANYPVGAEITFPNYSILRSTNGTVYLLDYDTLRPFASEEVVRELGYNPQEIVDVAANDLDGMPIGSTITDAATPPQGVIFQITDLGNTYFLLKENTLHPIADKQIIESNFKNLKIEKHKIADLKKYTMAETPVVFADGTLVTVKNSNEVYVIDSGKKRLISDDDTFVALGYKRANVKTVNLVILLNIPAGDPLYVNDSLLSSKNKFLGDSAGPVSDLYKSSLPAYLVAEYPSGRIVSGKNIDDRHPMASLTKLLTSFEALNQKFDLKKTSVFDAKKHSSTGSSVTLKNGQKVKNSDLLNATLIASANNASRMVAQGTGLTEGELLEKVSTRLENWGADNTTLVDVTGLREDNKSSARDLLKIFTKVTENATMKKTLGATSFTFGGKTITNTNALAVKANTSYKVIASKTGYIDEGGSTLIMLVESKKTKKQYIIITLGNPNYAKRFEEPDKIAKWISTGNVKVANQ